MAQNKFLCSKHSKVFKKIHRDYWSEDEVGVKKQYSFQCGEQ